MIYHRTVVEMIPAALYEIFWRGKYADRVIEFVHRSKPKWGSKDRKIFAETIYDICRWWRLLWWSIDIKEPNEQALWRIVGAYFLRKHGKLPDWEEFKALKLRKGSPPTNAIKESYPDWLYMFGQSELPGDWEELATVLNSAAPVTLRTNTLKINRTSLQKLLLKENVETYPHPEVKTALVLTKRLNVFRTESFSKGYFEVQDAASQLVAPALNVKPGMRVIDACAGAGGKTLHIAQLMNNKGKIIAMDVHEWKLVELMKRARRAGISIIEPRVIENKKIIKRLDRSADRLLLDVPCSGIGVLRRNPDTKWKLTPVMLKKLFDEQAYILTTYSNMAVLGGELVYSTCSLFPSENEFQIDSFIKRNTAWRVKEVKRFTPQKDATKDGFFIASLSRTY